LKGKPWTVEEEKQLKDLVAAKTPLHVIAQLLHKRKGAVEIKCRRLDIEVEVAKKKSVPTTTSIIPLPEELPSVEEALKMLAGALKSACTAGLTKVEVQRLRVLSQIARTYEVMLANFVNYREIEARIADMEKKYESLLREKTSDVAAQNNNE
jgi:DNA repair ATPase RecN